MREGERKGCGESENSQASLVPRPTCAFYISAAVGLLLFLTSVTQRVEG